MYNMFVLNVKLADENPFLLVSGLPFRKPDAGDVAGCGTRQGSARHKLVRPLRVRPRPSSASPALYTRLHLDRTRARHLFPSSAFGKEVLCLRFSGTGLPFRESNGPVFNP
jgi:hypothetical protein